MADKPSRSLVIYGDGFAQLIAPSHGHLNSFASHASCGFLSLRQSLPSETEHKRAVREVAQLFGVYDHLVNGETSELNLDFECQKVSSIPTISERFMGLKAAMLTTNSCVGSLGKNLGFDVFHFNELVKIDGSLGELPDAFSMASESLIWLGFQCGEVHETSKYDLVFIYVGSGKTEKQSQNKHGVNAELEWIDKFVGFVMQLVSPSSIGSRLHLSIVMSHGYISENEDHNSSTLNSLKKISSDLSFLFPQQSYTMISGVTIKKLRHHSPLLIAQLQEAVTRKDLAKEFSFKEFKEHGGNHAIPADRFLCEVAFKLWKAPKYGA